MPWINASNPSRIVRPLPPDRQPPPGAAPAVFREYASDILKMFGATRVGWGISNPDVLYAYFTDVELMQLADSALRDSVNGATMSIRLDPSPTRNPGVVPPHLRHPHTEKIPWHERESNMARSVAALPGVHDFEIDRRSGSASFYVVSKPATERLKPLVSEQLGSLRTSFVTYIPGVPQPKPPAPPAPPAKP